MKNIFTLSGKKKFLASLCGLAAAVLAAQPASHAPGAVIPAIAVIVLAYLAAETSVDKQRAASALQSTLLYAAREMQSTTSPTPL